MKPYFIKLLVFILIFINLCCENDSENDLVDVVDVPLVTYNNNVKTIIDDSCIRCHTDPPINGAPMPLLIFDQVRDAVVNRELTTRISSNDNSTVMPPGGPRLPQPIIDIIIQWNTDGLLE